MKTKEATLASIYEEFEDAELKTYFKNELEKNNEEYAGTIGEYRDGLLIFEVMNNNIWKKAKNDTIGLQEFYNKEKENYRWKERIDVALVSATSEKVAARVQEMFKTAMTAEEIKAKLFEEDITLIVTKDTLEIDSNILPENFNAKRGISEIYRDENSYVVANVKEVLAPSIKDFEDVKGRVTTDYQNKLEKDWMQRLRSGHTVKVNKKTLKKVIKELKP